MNDVPRPELDAKLELIETRMDARLASIESKIDAFIAAQAARDATQGIRNSGFETSIRRLEKATGEVRTSINAMKTTLIVTAITTVLAIVFGIASFNSALTSNMLAAFQAGKGEVRSAPRAGDTVPGQPVPPATK